MEVELINLHLLVVHTFQRKKFDSPMTHAICSAWSRLFPCCWFVAHSLH